MPGWIDQQRVTGTLGPFDSPTYLHESWNGSVWDTANLELYHMDSLEHQVLFEYYDWSPGWTQTIGSRNEYLYDGLGQTQQITTSFWDQGQYVPAWLDVFANYFTKADAALSAVTSVTAYPNPCSDHLNFAMDVQQNGPIEIAIYDQQGRLRTKSISAAMIGQKFSMPVSDFLENGTYIYVVKAKAGTATGKVVVQR